MRNLLSKFGRGGIVAVCALCLLAAVIGYRLFFAENTSSEIAAQVPSQGVMSLEQLEQRAANNPDDASAWQQLGFAYFDLGRFENAVSAYEKAAQADPENAVLWSSLGEARVMASQAEPLPPAAREAFRKAASIDPADPRARYFLAVEKDLADDHEGALADWLALLADTPPGAPWENDLVRTIEQVGTINSIAVESRIAQASAARDILPQGALGGIPGPTQEQMAAASALTPSEQQDMADGMVARLAARLESEPSDVDGWVMLIRSYASMGKEREARAALGRAVAANPGKAASLREAAQSLGISQIGHDWRQ